MSTMNQIVDAVMSEVYGYTATVDPTTHLTVAVDEADLQFTISDAKQFSRGIIQIDNELIVVDSADRTTGTLIAGSAEGRGVRGTAATSHAVGARVTMSPSIPRQQAIDSVNQTIRSSTGLYGIGSVDAVYVTARRGYPLPVEATGILSVTWLPPGPEQRWIPVRRWTFDRAGGQINIGEALAPGETFRVVYQKDPVVPSISDDFLVTGLPASCEDVIRFGAAWRIVSFLEPGSLMAQRAESEAMARKTQPNRVRTAQYLFQMYRQRLDEELFNLNNLYPTRVHFGG